MTAKIVNFHILNSLNKYLYKNRVIIKPIKSIRTSAPLKGVNYFGKETGTFNSPLFPPDVLNIMNDHLGVDTPEDTTLPAIIRAKREKERELKADAKAKGWFSRMFRGGTRRRTRRFKK